MNLLLKHSRFFFLATILVYAFVSGFGSMTMTMDKDGAMSTCPFMNTDSICQMDVFEHIAIFQSMFTGVPEVSLWLPIALLAIVSLLVSSYAQNTNMSSPPQSRSSLTYFEPRIFNTVLLAISDGTLQPKIYA